MNYGILPTLTRDYILSKITQEQIFEYYLGIKVQTEVLLITPSVIRSRDSNPTFSFKYSNNGKLRARDWAGYFWGDCFDVVAHILRVSPTDKKSFNLILDKIARDFRLHKYADKDYIHTGDTYDSREVIKQPKETIIQFQPRNWDKNDAKFWLAGNINSKLLEIGRVYPCYYVWINSDLKYNYNPKDPAYAYYFKQNAIKIYFPMRKEYRFLNNSSYLQGLDLLFANRFGIVTKSYKDVLVLRSYGIPAVAPSSETVLITKDEWDEMNKYCKYWFSLLDFDRTGIIMTRKLRKAYNTIPLFFSQYKPLIKSGGQFTGQMLAKHYPNFTSVKDSYDYRRLFGHESTLKLVEETQIKINEILDKEDIRIKNTIPF